MQVLKRLKSTRLFTPALAAMAFVVVAALWGIISIAYADGADTAPYTLDVGYLDFTYGSDVTDVTDDHTESRPESKLWWHDGYWWASMWNEILEEYHIYRLNWGTQTWQDTGVALDDRPESRADALMDGDTGTLYVASHFKQDNPSVVNDPINHARLYRFTYDDAIETYVPDPGSPFLGINEDKTNTLVIDQESGGRMWATYVSRQQGAGDLYEVYVNASDDNGETWETPFSLLGVVTDTNKLAVDDVSSVVAFDNTVGVMWTNQVSGTLHFAEHTPGMPYNSGWISETVPLDGEIDDHLSLKANSAGQLFAAVKTTAEGNGEPLIEMVARDTDGTWSTSVYSGANFQDTRPILVVDEGNNQVYIFVTGKPGGSKICYKTATITSPLSNMEFVDGDCGIPFIEDVEYDRFDSATSSKHVVDNTTGLIVLASEDHSGRVYGHNVIGDPPPVLTQRSPGIGETNVALNAVVSVQFSKNMNVGTVVDTNNFTVDGGSGPIAGTIGYDGASRTATFTPTIPLSPNTIYTVNISDAMQDEGGKALYEAETWTFETGVATSVPSVVFSAASYSVNEDAGTVTATVNLSEASGQTVQVTYATASGTATSGADYTPVGGSLSFAPGETTKTFNVPILDDALDEPDETVNLTLSAPQNATLGTPSEAVVTIVDNDEPPTVQFSMADYTANEAAGTALITVQLSGPSGLATAVDYATSDGSATAGSDYVATSGTLDFAAGETSKTFTVNILNDVVAEGDETVNLTLSNPDDATLGTPSTATLTIEDDGDVEEEEFEIYLPVIFRR